MRKPRAIIKKQIEAKGIKGWGKMGGSGERCGKPPKGTEKPRKETKADKKN